VIARCAGQGQDFIETVLAYQAVVLLAPESAGLTCLSQSQVERCGRWRPDRSDLG